jgi:streptogrisin C
VIRLRALRPLSVAAVAIALSMIMVGPAHAAPAPDRASDPAAATTALYAALERDLHLTQAGVTQLLNAQAQAGDLERTMSAKLGADYGGAWFDRKSGKLVVAATTGERAALARNPRTQTRVVRHSLHELNGVKAALDATARRDKRAMAGVTAWSVDVEHNQVVLTVRPGQSKAVGAMVAGYGDAVRIQESALKAVVASDYLDGGDPFNGCSVGFNVVKDGVGYFLTAGHCGSAGQNTQQAGVAIGPFVESHFPDFDDALVRNDNSSYWAQGPWVYAYTDDPGVVYNISGFRDSPVGTAICKSGRTTGLTCGTITATDESVQVSDSAGNPLGTVYDLTRHTACVEPGDSGGSNISVTSSGNFAEGTTSAASVSSDGTRLRCQEVFGGTNQSWYFPVADAIPFYGVTLMTL